MKISRRMIKYMLYGALIYLLIRITATILVSYTFSLHSFIWIGGFFFPLFFFEWILLAVIVPISEITYAFLYTTIFELHGEQHVPNIIIIIMITYPVFICGAVAGAWWYFANTVKSLKKAAILRGSFQGAALSGLIIVSILTLIRLFSTPSNSNFALVLILGPIFLLLPPISIILGTLIRYRKRNLIHRDNPLSQKQQKADCIYISRKKFIINTIGIGFLLIVSPCLISFFL